MIPVHRQAGERCGRCSQTWPCAAVQDRPGTIKCPACDLRLLADYQHGQRLHLQTVHPELERSTF